MQVLVCDKDTSYMQAQLPASDVLQYKTLDIADQAQVAVLVEASELVVSMLPAFLHMHIARLCLQYGKHLATASYISDEMRALHSEVQAKGLIFLNEMGLDPGIDHMSAMQMMDGIRAKGGVITGFRSYCGGLVADEDDGDNPWKYKFSWNPRNVVLAAQGAPATYLESGKLKVMPYHQVFAHPVGFDIAGYGRLEAYPNRDSLKYTELYGLQGVETMLRGTFRKPGYCRAWQVLVALGMTDDQQVLHLPEDTGLKQWLQMYLPPSDAPLAEQVKSYTHCSDSETDKLEWLGLFGNEAVPLLNGSSAQILEELLKCKWKLESSDRDLVVMLHEISYRLNGKAHTHMATMVLKGESNTRTAMAKTVGLPLAFGVEMILENRLKARGVMAPVADEIYEPVLQALAGQGVVFVENEA